MQNLKQVLVNHSMIFTFCIVSVYICYGSMPAGKNSQLGPVAIEKGPIGPLKIWSISR